MDRFEDCRLIGRVGKPHGHEGSFRLELFPGLETDLNLDEPVFLLIEGKPVPFYLDECNEAAFPPILHFEDIPSIDHIRPYCGLEIYAPKNSVEAETNWTAEQLIGFSAFDGEFALGKLLDISDSGLQQLMHFEVNGKEVLVPLQEELILEVDEKKKLIYMQLPEGLINLYLEDN